jgi:asparagine synthase (glutamine-hydrolysing)
MCGISGVYGQSDLTGIEAMLARQRHRGPDGDGVTWLPGGTLGHTRLAILDIEGGRQPMGYGTTWITFNGEIYNHMALRRQYLPDQAFRTRSDTETILHLYRKLGPECIPLLDGMFALAIVDPTGLFLARDPLGIKPLYTIRLPDRLYFSSEIKALIMFGGGIREFPSGKTYHSQHGWGTYYQPGENKYLTPITSEAEAEQEIKLVLQDAVQKRLLSDVPLGISLSGGLDSSIVAALARPALERLETFAVGVAGSSDLAAAQVAARFLNTVHHERSYMESDMLRVLPEVIYHLESFDPALVRSAIPNYFLAQLAGEYVKVFLTGEGADELYAGYDYLTAYQDPENLQSELVRITLDLHNTNLQRADRMSMAHGLEARVPFLDIKAVNLAFAIPPAWKTHRPDRPPKTLLRRAFAGCLPEEILQRPKEKFSAGAGSSQILARKADQSVSDQEFEQEKERLLQEWNYNLLNKEALYYYYILRQSYQDEWIFPNMGHSRSL